MVRWSVGSGWVVRWLGGQLVGWFGGQVYIEVKRALHRPATACTDRHPHYLYTKMKKTVHMPATACYCPLLSATACYCRPLPATACYCLLLPATACCPPYLYTEMKQAFQSMKGDVMSSRLPAGG